MFSPSIFRTKLKRQNAVQNRFRRYVPCRYGGHVPRRPLYAPVGMQWPCRSNDMGMDGGALLIDETRLIGVENFCRLLQPTPIRDMDAVLYDATCNAEGMEYSLRGDAAEKAGRCVCHQPGWRRRLVPVPLS